MSGKSGVIEFKFGWIFNNFYKQKLDHITIYNQMETVLPDYLYPLFLGLFQFIANVWPWLLLLFGFLFFRKLRFEAIIILLLIILFNCLKLSYWDYDQLKVFIALYIISIALLNKLPQKQFNLYFILFILLLTPALIETVKMTLQPKWLQYLS